MKNWYLIQRCSKNSSSTDFNVGVDKILDFDYMGSAEFEFGALGKTVRAFRALKGEIQLSKSIKTRFNKPVWVISPKGVDMSEIEKQLISLGNNEIKLKEPSYFDYYFDKKASDYKKKITAWLVLDEPVFFTVDEGVARMMFAELKLEKAST